MTIYGSFSFITIENVYKYIHFKLITETRKNVTYFVV